MHEQINSHNKLRWDFRSKPLTNRKESFLNLYFESLGKENFDFSFLLSCLKNAEKGISLLILLIC